MTLEELEGRYVSAKAHGPGTRYLLDLEGPRAGLKPGERFVLESAAWALTGRSVPGTDRPDVQLIGSRKLEGAYRLDGSGLALEVRRLTDTAGDGRGLGHPPPIRRTLSEVIVVEVLAGRSPAVPALAGATEVAGPAGPKLELRFKLYGSLVELSKSL